MCYEFLLKVETRYFFPFLCFIFWAEQISRLSIIYYIRYKLFPRSMRRAYLLELIYFRNFVTVFCISFLETFERLRHSVVKFVRIKNCRLFHKVCIASFVTLLGWQSQRQSQSSELWIFPCCAAINSFFILILVFLMPAMLTNKHRGEYSSSSYAARPAKR